MFLRASREYHLAFRVPKFAQCSSCDIKRDSDFCTQHLRRQVYVLHIVQDPWSKPKWLRSQQLLTQAYVTLSMRHVRGQMLIIYVLRLVTSAVWVTNSSGKIKVPYFVVGRVVLPHGLEVC